MNIERKLDQIINESLPALSRGEVTIESVLSQYPQIATELRPRLEAALWLQRVKNTVEPRPGHIIASRKYIEAQIASMPPRGFWQKLFSRYSPQRWVFNFAAPVIITLLLVLVVNSAVLAARLAIPGEPLYGTKLFIEGMRMALTIDQLQRTELAVELTRERTTEIVELVLEGEYDYLPSAAARLEKGVIVSVSLLEAIPDDLQAPQHAMVTDFKVTLANEILMLNVLKNTAPTYAHTGIELAINAAQTGLNALQ